MSAADRLAVVLQSPGLDLSGAEEAALVWLGRLLREPRSVTRDALGELHAAGRLVVRPSPLGAGLMRYTVGPAVLVNDFGKGRVVWSGQCRRRRRSTPSRTPPSSMPPPPR